MGGSSPLWTNFQVWLLFRLEIFPNANHHCEILIENFLFECFGQCFAVAIRDKLDSKAVVPSIVFCQVLIALIAVCICHVFITKASLWSVQAETHLYCNQEFTSAGRLQTDMKKVEILPRTTFLGFLYFRNSEIYLLFKNSQLWCLMVFWVSIYKNIASNMWHRRTLSIL